MIQKRKLILSTLNVWVIELILGIILYAVFYGSSLV